MKKIALAFICSASLVSGCANMSNTEQRTLSGAGIGAAVGGIGAALFHGNPVWGIVGGAAVGAASGYVYDMYEKDKQAQYNKGYQAGKASSTNSSSSSSGSK